MNADSDIVQKAKDLALRAHKGQKLYNKADGDFVMTHIEEVATLVKAAGGSPEAIAAAWLHDTVEDTDVTLEDIEDIFGNHVETIVDGLTDPVDFKELPLTERKQMQADRSAKLSNEVKMVKLADQTSNCRLAGTPHRTWSVEKCLEYIEGLHLVAKACRGASPQLDDMFAQAYESSKETLLSLKAQSLLIQ